MRNIVHNVHSAHKILRFLMSIKPAGRRRCWPCWGGTWGFQMNSAAKLTQLFRQAENMSKACTLDFHGELRYISCIMISAVIMQ